LAGIDLPTRNAMVPTLVSREKYPAAAALNQIIWQLGLVAGPALAGIVISQVSLASAYWLDVGTFGVAIVSVVGMHAHPPMEEDADIVATRTPGGWGRSSPRALARSIVEGL